MTHQIFEETAMFTQAELVPILRKSKSWFERARWAGTGPRYTKVGRSVLYRGSDLNAWIEAQTIQNTGQRS